MSSAASASRPARQRERPNSAVYIGKDPLQLQHIGSIPPSLPDLPEPPSPVSSTGSGLPSPPATNSTGSGSTGDPASIAFRGGAKGNMPLLEEPYVKAFHSAFEQQQRSQGSQRYDALDDDEDDIDNNNNDYQTHDDDTAKFHRSQNSNTSNENAVALERVKSLQERNRSVLNKLNSYSRLSTPSPNPSQVRSKDAISRADSSSTSSSSSRPSLNRSHRHSYHNDGALQRDLSGSETERESARGQNNSYDDDDDDFHAGQPSSILLNHTSNLDRSLSTKTPGRPTTPTFREPALPSHFSPRSGRTRLISAPASPGKALSSISRATSGSGGQLSPLSSPGRPRKRASMGLPSISHSVDLRGRDDVTNAALTAVANSRRGLVGTTGTGKKRQPLPREFWDGSSSSSGMNGGGSVSRRGSLSSSDGHADEYYDQESILQERDPSVSTSTLARTNSIANSSRSSRQSDPRYSATLTPGGRKRYYSNTRRTSGAWASEDLGNRTSEFGEDDEYSPVMGRRQTARPGGSADSVLTIAPGAGGRSLIGEGLKAAGLSKRASTGGGGGRDVFVTGSMRRDGSPVFERDRDREREERLERIRSQSRAESRPMSRGPSTSRHGRAVTSMAEYGRRDEVDLDDDISPRTAPAHLRAYKSSYNLVGRERSDDMDRERAPSSMNRNGLDDRAPLSATSSVAPSIISPLGTRRYNTINSPDIMSARGDDGPPPSARRNGAIDRSDHTRLLNSSLELFEGALSKIPSSSSSSSASNTDDLVRNGRVIVGAVEKLNALLKSGHGRALNAQIDCEVQAAGGGGGTTAEEVWRLVGGEYRESLRVSDDLVRAVTDFMLGVGRAVKDLDVDHESLVNGDHHTRSVSLDEVGVSRLGRASLSPDVTGGSGGARSSGSATSGGGRSRRSWDPTPGRDTDTLRRIAGSRPETSLGVSSATHTPLNRTTGRAGTPRDNPPSASSSASVRRLLSPREIRDQQLMRDEGGPGGMSTLDSRETLHASSYEPSPTPTSRAGLRVQPIIKDKSPLPERSRTVPSHAIPPPLPILPSESRHQTPSTATKGTHASSASTLSRRRTTQVASTVRGPAFPLTTPNAPTTAVTTTHVSGSPEKRAFPLVRGNSNTSSASGDERGARSSVTFSRSSTTTALTGLQQQQQRAEQQRNRSLSNSSDLRDDGHEGTNSVNVASSSKTPASARIQRVTSGGGSETERDVYRRGGTIRDKDGSRAPRISFDEASIGVKAGAAAAASSAHAADRAAMSTIGQKRERRRTVVDMWPRGGN